MRALGLALLLAGLVLPTRNYFPISKAKLHRYSRQGRRVPFGPLLTAR